MLSQLPSYSYIQNSLESGSTQNSRKNIISGPGKTYWNHSPGLEAPEIAEDGPFPIMGNIGSLLKQEGNNNYASCSSNVQVGGSPNCVGVFNSDVYTKKNTCGDNCKLQAPEAFGMQSFGMNEDKLTNIHSLHSYKNVRAASEGRGPSSSYGCKEWLPALRKTAGDSCEIDYSKWESSTTGNFTKLPNNFTNYTYTQ